MTHNFKMVWLDWFSIFSTGFLWLLTSFLKQIKKLFKIKKTFLYIQRYLNDRYQRFQNVLIPNPIKNLIIGSFNLTNRNHFSVLLANNEIKQNSLIFCIFSAINIENRSKRASWIPLWVTHFSIIEFSFQN